MNLIFETNINKKNQLSIFLGPNFFLFTPNNTDYTLYRFKENDNKDTFFIFKRSEKVLNDINPISLQVGIKYRLNLYKKLYFYSSIMYLYKKPFYIISDTIIYKNTQYVSSFTKSESFLGFSFGLSYNLKN